MTNTGTPSATPITDPATATPVDIDTRLAELDRDFHRQTGMHAARLDDVHRCNGERARWVSRSRKAWPTDTATVLTELADKLAAGAILPHDVDRATRALAAVEASAELLEANRAEFERLDAEYDRRPWRRYIGVLGGHIHSGYRCAGGTIRVTTQLTWQPQLSGKDVATAVAELGPLLCTHCFPDAPVAWQAGHAKPARCAGSGRAPIEGTVGRQGMSIYGKCQGCSTNHIVTASGVIRAHKPVAE